MIRILQILLLLANTGHDATPAWSIDCPPAHRPDPVAAAGSTPAIADTSLFKERFGLWRADPVQFVRDHFQVEPQEWQRDVLESLLTDPRIAMMACKGPGKSTILAWAGWWILACHVDAQGNALSITSDNLRDNLWKELAKWMDRSDVLQRMFTQNSEAIRSKFRPKTWFLTARSFSKRANTEEQEGAIAGLHQDHVFILLDEVGDMAPGVISAAKGIFAVKGQRGWLLAAGNPTSQDGALYWITTTDARRWKIVSITGDPDDPRRSPLIDIDNAREEIKTLSRDNPWVMVNILGLFPPVGANKLLGANDVTLAMGRDIPLLHYMSDARIWGLDPARSDKSGADEASLCKRQGLLCTRFETWRGLDGTELGDAVAFRILEEQKAGKGPDAIFVDVGGVGASAYDRLVHLGWGHLVHAVDFGSKARQVTRYHNKRTEMWVDMAEWIQKRPSCLPNDPVLRAELPEPRYHFRVINRSTKFILESKDDLKARGVQSPNRSDSLCLTFAAPVEPHSAKERLREHGALDFAETEYDPLERSGV